MKTEIKILLGCLIFLLAGVELDWLMARDHERTQSMNEHTLMAKALATCSKAGRPFLLYGNGSSTNAGDYISGIRFECEGE